MPSPSETASGTPSRNTSRVLESADTRSVAGDDAHEVQGIGPADCQQLAGRRRTPHLAHGLDGLRQGELLARHSGDEPAAADFASRLEAAVDHDQLAPGRDVRLARQQPAEDDAIPLEQDARLDFDGGVSTTASAMLTGTADQRPPAAAGVRDCLRE